MYFGGKDLTKGIGYDGKTVEVTDGDIGSDRNRIDELT